MNANMKLLEEKHSKERNKMKRNFKLLLSSVLMSMVIAGCGEAKESPNASTPSTSTPTESTPIQNSSTEEVHHDPVTITYSAWNLGSADSDTPNLDRMMIDEFQKKYPWITVNIIERPKVAGTNDDMNWNEFLTARAATNRLPDVFIADTIPTYVQNNWVRPLNDLISADPEYQMLSQDIRNAAVYEGMTMALPISVYYHGYVVNKTLFDRQNGDAPTSESTWTEFLNEIRACAVHQSGGRGVVGLDGIEHIIHYYPSLLNDKYEWFTFDGEKFNLDSQEFAKTIEFYLSLYNDKSICIDGLSNSTEEQIGEKVDFFGEGNYFDDGKELAAWKATYDLGAVQAKIASGEYGERELDFIGVPAYEDGAGNTIKRTMASLDFNVISSTTKNPEEAYLLAKWMGFGTEGYAKRLEISKNTEGIDVLTFAPIVPNEELMDEFFKLYPGWDEYRKVVESQSFIIEPLKYQVGYNECRYKGTYGSEDTMFTIINKIITGQQKLSDIASELNRRINEIYQENVTVFNAALEQYYK